uniref:Putative serine/threonine-protein kinase SAPK2 isoform X2 n=1 Tax=Davidia involucrata TaxID=16924 RepID=A0A5B7A1B3_DAVIN
MLNVSQIVLLQRITIPEIKNDPWFLKNLPIELMEGGSFQSNDVNNPSQSVEEILSIIREAKTLHDVVKPGPHLVGGIMDLDDLDDADIEDVETSGDFVCSL